MKLNKKYYSQVLEELAKLINKDKNKLAQILEHQLKNYSHKFEWSTDEVVIQLSFYKIPGKER